MEPRGTSICWSVTALVRAVGDTLKARFAAVQVQGEISGFTRAASGHCYFTLKDETSQIRCVMFARSAALLSFAPQTGHAVEVRGRLALYEARGDLQLTVEAMTPAGQGLLLERFQQLKGKLEREGLFDSRRKRGIPPYPQTVGVVSSLHAAALHDVLTALKRRAPQVGVVVYPASVQGTQAVSELVAAITAANARQDVDTLLICRGGGSMEDLWSFNEEAVVRAVAASNIPTISGVGHETDFTLTELAADMRAPTPTAAAELAARPRQDIQQHVDQLAQRLMRVAHGEIDMRAQRVDRAALVFSQPANRLHEQRQRLDAAVLRLTAAARRKFEHMTQLLVQCARLLPVGGKQVLRQEESRLAALNIRWQKQNPVAQIHGQQQRLQQLALRYQWAMRQQISERSRYLGGQQWRLSGAASKTLRRYDQQVQTLHVRLTAQDPTQVLARGYVWVSDERGQVLTSVAQLNPGQHIEARFADGRAYARVEQVLPDLLMSPEEDEPLVGDK